MADLIKKIKIKKQDGTFTDYIPIGVEAQNVNVDGESVGSKLNKKPYNYSTLSEMKEDLKLKAGDVAITLGYYDINDGGAGEYLIINNLEANIDNGSIIALNNGLKAKLLVKNNIINVKQFGAKGDNLTDDTEAIKNALSFNGNNYIKVIFNPGYTYLAKGYIDIYSNTDIEFKDAIIKDCDEGDYSGHHAGLTFRSAVLNANIAGYGATKNINVEGGTFNGNVNGVMFALIHVENFNLKNTYFLDCFIGRHIIDMCGCKNINITNCIFDGNYLVDETVTYREMIQPDYARESSGSYWGSGITVGYDILPTIDLTIEKCIFKKGNGNYHPNAIGTHARGPEPHANIIIKNCEFYDCTFSCIRLPLCKNVVIDNNTFYDLTPRRDDMNVFAINMQYISDNTYNNASENITISNNKFLFENDVDGNLSCIRIIGPNNSENLVKNIKILNNYSTSNYHSDDNTSGSDLAHLSRCDNVIIDGNTCIKNKHLLYKPSSGAIIKSILVTNNVMKYLRDYISSVNTTYSEDNFCNIEEHNNIWEDSRGSINLNNFKITLKLSTDIESSQSDEKIKITYDNIDNNFITVANDGTIQVPKIFRKIRVYAYTAVSSTVSKSDSEALLYITNRFSSKSEFTESYATLSTSKTIKYPILYLDAYNDKVHCTGFNIQHLKWLTTSETIKASANNYIATQLVIESL